MSHDNAALEIVTINSEPDVGDEFARMSERELAEYTARTLSTILAIADLVKDQIGPLLDSVQGNPMLKMLIGRR